MKKSIGIVGFGEMGKRHGLDFREATKGLITIAGVVEPSDEMYRKGCEWNKMAPPRFATIAEMLDHGGLDGALITSPNHLHATHLREFSGQRFPILLEKPLDIHLEAMCEIVRFAKSYAGVIVVDHVMRYAPIIRKAKQLIDDGKLGRVASFQFSQRLSSGMLHTFRRSLQSGGGQMLEKATHDLDVMLYLCGSLPKRVAMISKQQLIGGEKPNDLRCSDCSEVLTCTDAHVTGSVISAVKDVNIDNDLCIFAEEADVADNETCLIELMDGVFGTYSHTYFCQMPGHSRIYEVIGTNGAFHLQLSAEDPGHRGILKYYPRGGSGEVATYEFGYAGKIHYNGGQFLARHFYRLMCGEENEAFTTVNQAFVAEVLGLAAMKAAREENFVRVDSLLPDNVRQAYAAPYRGE